MGFPNMPTVVLANEGMTLIAVLFLAAIITVVFLLRKGASAVGNALDKAVYRSEIQEGKNIVSKPMTFTSSLPVSEIRSRIMQKVTAATESKGINPILYIKTNADSAILFAYGNRFADNFIVALHLLEKGGGTSAIFKVTNWKEQSSGLIVGHDHLERLQRQVSDVFQAS